MQDGAEQVAAELWVVTRLGNGADVDEAMDLVRNEQTFELLDGPC